jgi:ferredoxin
LAGLHDRLLAQFDSPRWAEIAERCLMCANCSMVCPTCFCSSVTQRSDLDGHVSTSERVWDFCFTSSFARVAGGNFRNRPRDRYRQWLTHKFATWIDQFGTFGCVGCGRCIAWCPVGIDSAPGCSRSRRRSPPGPSQANERRPGMPQAGSSPSEEPDVTTLRWATWTAFLAGSPASSR